MWIDMIGTLKEEKENTEIKAVPRESRNTK